MFTVAATLTLAIAIGATTAVFGLVDGVLLARFPFPGPDRVLHVLESNPASQLPVLPVSAADYLDWRAQSKAFSAIAALDFGAVTVTGDQEPERLVRDAVTPNYFTVFATPMLGRAPVGGLQRPAGSSHQPPLLAAPFQGCASSAPRQDADRQRHIICDCRRAPGQHAQAQADLWTRLSFNGQSATDRRDRPFDVYGRLAPGVTPEEGLRELQTIAARLGTAYPETNSLELVGRDELAPRRCVWQRARPALSPPCSPPRPACC